MNKTVATRKRLFTSLLAKDGLLVVVDCAIAKGDA
jgi:hypothetical protein